MKTTHIALLAALAVALLAPATGFASLPKPKDAVIDVPKSIGGVELKEGIRKADRAWGKSGECDFGSNFESCVFAGKNARTGQASIEAAARGKVTSFGIQAGLTEKDRWVFKGRLLKFATEEGIGLGDNGRKVMKNYPEAIKAANKTGYFIEGKGRSYMSFQTLDGKHITGITVADGKHQG